MPVPKKFAYQSARASWPLLSFATRLSKHRTRHRQASCSPKILQIWSCRMKNLQKTESSNLQKHLCAESTTISVCLTTGFVIDNRGDMGAGAMELEGKFSEAGPESDSGPGRAATARGVPEPSCGPCGHDSRSFLRVARHWSPGPRASGDRRGQPSHGRAKAGGETRACGPSTRFTLDRGRDSESRISTRDGWPRLVRRLATLARGDSESRIAIRGHHSVIQRLFAWRPLQTAHQREAREVQGQGRYPRRVTEVRPTMAPENKQRTEV